MAASVPRTNRITRLAVAEGRGVSVEERAHRAIRSLVERWKANQEASKKEGLILSCKVLTTEGHSPPTYNIILLMTEYKDCCHGSSSCARACVALGSRAVGR
jgi:hypothetical protein